jgi:hypothetical protein
VKKRLDSLKRIERLQRRLNDLSVWRLAALGHRKDELTRAHLEMLEAASDGLLAVGAPAAAATRRIRALEVELLAARGGYDAQAKLALEQGRKSKLAERASAAAASDYRADLEKRNLSELIGQAVKRRLAARERNGFPHGDRSSL